MRRVESEPTAELVFSAEVTDFEDRGDHVLVRFIRDGVRLTTTGRFAVGCDGSGSTVREKLGASFPGRTYRMNAALADIRLPGVRDAPFPRMTRQRTVATALRTDRDTWGLMMPFTYSSEASVNELVDLAVADLFGSRAYEVLWMSEFRLHKRVSEIWADVWVTLAGDAAHLNSPVGGRGMIVGLQDARALMEVLDQTLETGVGDPFSGYVEERQEALRGATFRLLDLIKRLLILGRGFLLFPTLRFAGLVMKLGPIRRRVLRNLAMLDDPSRDSVSAQYSNDRTKRLPDCTRATGT